MSRLADVLAQQMGGEVRGSVVDQLAELRTQYGSLTAAARAAGVDRRTLQRWASGAIRAPKESTVAKIGRAVREARTHDRPPQFNVPFRYDGRPRNPTFGGASGLQLTPGTVESMQAAYARGDKEGIARAFINGVEDDFYGPAFEEAYAGEVGDYHPEFV